jgi:hypothetical protein
MVQDPRIRNQQGALKLGSQLGPSSRRCPKLLSAKLGPITPLGPSPQRPTRVPTTSKPLRPDPPRHFWVPRATGPQGLSPWR